MSFRLKVGSKYRNGSYANIDDARFAAQRIANETGSKVSVWNSEELPSFKAYRETKVPGRAKSSEKVNVRPGQAPANRKRTVKTSSGNTMSKAMAMRNLFSRNPDRRGNPTFGDYYFINNFGDYITDKSLSALMRKAEKVANETGKKIRIMQEDLSREKVHAYTSKSQRR